MRTTRLTLCLFLPVLPAQTFIVDAANGPGTHFTSIAAATAAVHDGSTLVVRAGAYAGFSISGKGLTLLGQPGVTVQGVLPPTVSISGTTAAQAIVVRGLAFTGAFDTLWVYACQGPVLLEHVDDQSSFCNCTGTPPSMLVVADSAQVSIRDCTARGVSVSNSNVAIEGCSVRGYGTVCGFGSCSSPYAAIQAAGGSTQVVDCVLRGGAGGSSFTTSRANQPAIQCSGELRVLAPCTLIAGSDASVAVAPAIGGSANVRLDPGVVLQTAAVPAVVAASLLTQPMPAVRSDGGAPGSSVSAAALGPIGSATVLLLGLPGPALVVPGVADPFWIDATAYQFAAFGVPQTGQPVAVVVAVPNVPALSGFRLAWQSVVPAAPWQVSNPSLTLVR